MTAEKLTAREMNRAIYSHFAGRWAVLTEVTARAQYALPEQTTDDGAMFSRFVQQKVASERRIDVLLVRGGGGKSSGGIERLAIEVKVTRQDFRNDVANPDKQAPWRAIAHRHAYAVPEGLVAEAEVPGGSGLLVVKRSKHAFSGFTARWVRQAKKPAGHEPGPLPLANLMDAYWRAGRAEARIKGYDGETRDQQDADAMRAEIARLRADLDRTHKRIDREAELRAMWQRAYGACTPPPCGTCGQPLHLSTSRRRMDAGTWEHRDTAAAEACRLLRHADAVRRNDERDPRFRMDPEFLYVEPPEPVDVLEHATS